MRDTWKHPTAKQWLGITELNQCSNTHQFSVGRFVDPQYIITVTNGQAFWLKTHQFSVGRRQLLDGDVQLVFNVSHLLLQIANLKYFETNWVIKIKIKSNNNVYL